VLVHQVLVDGRGVALELQLRFDERPVWFAKGGGHRLGDRWPGWGNLLCDSDLRIIVYAVGAWRCLDAVIAGDQVSCLGGHPGGICLFSLPTALVASDGLAVNARDAGDLSLRGIALQRCVDRGALVGFQDIHSFGPPSGKTGTVVLRTGASNASVYTLSPISSGGGVSGGHHWGNLTGPRGFFTININFNNC